MLIQEPESSYYTFHHEELPDFSQVYHFTTRLNLVYNVYFSISEYDHWLTNFPYLLRNGYAFGFNPFFAPADCKKQTDKSIFITLCKIIDAFITLNGNDCVLLYHCDHVDNRQAYRNKLFDSWYAASPYSEQIVKHDLEIIWANNKEFKSYYLGYLTPKSNPNLAVVRAEFEELSFRLYNGK